MCTCVLQLPVCAADDKCTSACAAMAKKKLLHAFVLSQRFADNELEIKCHN